MAQQARNKKLLALAFILIGVVTAAAYLPFLNVPQPTLGNNALLVKMDLENNDFKAVYDLLFGTADLDAGNYSFSPPVPIYKALDIALQDGWNASSLKNMTVHIHLDSRLFFENVSGNDINAFIIGNNLTLPGWGHYT